MRSISRLAGTLAGLLIAAAPVLAAVPLWDQSNLSTQDAYDISEAVTANDFALASGALLTGATVWLSDGAQNDNGLLDNFGGTLGWAIYQANGSGVPGTLVATGTAVNLLVPDTGLGAGGGDLVQASFELSEAVALSAGTYFLALRDGAWGSGYDGSSIYWVIPSAIVGEDAKGSFDLATPGSWFDILFDSAFALYAGSSVWDQRGTIGSFGFEISEFVAAMDFTLDEQKSFSAADVWLYEDHASDDGVLSGFSGTLGWAIYDDDGGKPGTLVASGSDTAPRLVDTGRQSGTPSADLFRARIQLGRQTVPAGTYWFALHEGAWASAYDNSSIEWATAQSVVGYGFRQDTNPAAPSSWSATGASDAAFLLFDDQLFAAGFESGGVCAWSNTPAIDCP